jgi:hypothetical protein
MSFGTCPAILNIHQGAKAAQKRERNTANSAKGGKSQLKSNEASKNIICQTCKQPFVSNMDLVCK